MLGLSPADELGFRRDITLSNGADDPRVTRDIRYGRNWTVFVPSYSTALGTEPLRIRGGNENGQGSKQMHLHSGKWSQRRDRV